MHTNKITSKFTPLMQNLLNGIRTRKKQLINDANEF